MFDRLSAYSPYALAVLRIVVALLFIEHGTMKLFGFPSATPMEVSLFSLIGLAGALELIGGLLVLFGLFTRIAAFVLSGEMAVAYFMAHASQSFWPIENQGEAAILFCFAFLYLVFAGPGSWSVDGMRSKASA